MTVATYEPHKHYEMLLTWLKERNAYLPTPGEMPENGLVVYNSLYVPIAAIFIRKVEGGHGQIDGLTTNPKASSRDRHIAANLAISHCIDLAKSLKIRYLSAYTQDKKILERGMSHGLSPLPHLVMAMDLGERS